MTEPKQEEQQDLQAEFNSESKPNHHLSEFQEYSLGADGDAAHLTESLRDYLLQLQSLRESRFYLSDQVKDSHQFRMSEIDSSD
jgi:hypothetical protein